jgi:hypothetical protein
MAAEKIAETMQVNDVVETGGRRSRRVGRFCGMSTDIGHHFPLLA